MAYIVFEGGEGSGKSTQVNLLAKRFSRAVVTREPGGTPLGSKLRDVLLADVPGVPITAEAEALIMAADRAQHLDELVRPNLLDNKLVISDRSVYSSVAYQGGGRQLGADWVWELNKPVVEDCLPGLVILLNVEPSISQARLGNRGEGLDRLELAGDGFHQRVAQTYRSLATADPDRWVVVPAEGSVEQVAERVDTVVDNFLQRNNT